MGLHLCQHLGSPAGSEQAQLAQPRPLAPVPTRLNTTVPFAQFHEAQEDSILTERLQVALDENNDGAAGASA